MIDLGKWASDDYRLPEEKPAPGKSED